MRISRTFELAQRTLTLLRCHMWTSANVRLEVIESAILAYLTNLEAHTRDGGGLPLGQHINPELVNPESSLRKKAQKVLAHGGQVDLGRMRVFSGGAVMRYQVNQCPLDLKSDSLSHQEVWDRIVHALGDRPVQYYPVPFRDWEAPGTFGRFDGGGTGRNDQPVNDLLQDFVYGRCFLEGFEEVGLIVEDSLDYGRVSYRFEQNQELSSMINDGVRAQWALAHYRAPRPICTFNVSQQPLPDYLNVEGMKGLANMKLAMEWENASLEAVYLLDMVPHNMPQGGKLRFIDLETDTKGRGLNRRIGIVLVGANRRSALISFMGGRFDKSFPLIPLERCFVPDVIGNTKFNAIRKILAPNG